ncbi:hypothetical protein MC885_014741, partial [Smutsia gigantea]
QEALLDERNGHGISAVNHPERLQEDNTRPFRHAQKANKVPSEVTDLNADLVTEQPQIHESIHQVSGLTTNGIKFKEGKLIEGQQQKCLDKESERTHTAYIHFPSLIFQCMGKVLSPHQLHMAGCHVKGHRTKYISLQDQNDLKVQSNIDNNSRRAFYAQEIVDIQMACTGNANITLGASDKSFAGTLACDQEVSCSSAFANCKNITVNAGIFLGSSIYVGEKVETEWLLNDPYNRKKFLLLFKHLTAKAYSILKDLVTSTEQSIFERRRCEEMVSSLASAWLVNQHEDKGLKVFLKLQTAEESKPHRSGDAAVLTGGLLAAVQEGTVYIVHVRRMKKEWSAFLESISGEKAFRRPEQPGAPRKNGGWPPSFGELLSTSCQVHKESSCLLSVMDVDGGGLSPLRAKTLTYAPKLADSKDGCVGQIQPGKKIIGVELNEVLRCMLNVDISMPQDVGNREERYGSNASIDIYQSPFFYQLHVLKDNFFLLLKYGKVGCDDQLQVHWNPGPSQEVEAKSLTFSLSSETELWFSVARFKFQVKIMGMVDIGKNQRFSITSKASQKYDVDFKEQVLLGSMLRRLLIKKYMQWAVSAGGLGCGSVCAGGAAMVAGESMAQQMVWMDLEMTGLDIEKDQSSVMLIKEFKHFILKSVEKSGRRKLHIAVLGWAAHARLPQPLTLLLDISDAEGKELGVSGILIGRKGMKELFASNDHTKTLEDSVWFGFGHGSNTYLAIMIRGVQNGGSPPELPGMKEFSKRNEDMLWLPVSTYVWKSKAEGRRERSKEMWKQKAHIQVVSEWMMSESNYCEYNTARKLVEAQKLCLNLLYETNTLQSLPKCFSDERLGISTPLWNPVVAHHGRIVLAESPAGQMVLVTESMTTISLSYGLGNKGSRSHDRHEKAHLVESMQEIIRRKPNTQRLAAQTQYADCCLLSPLLLVSGQSGHQVLHEYSSTSSTVSHTRYSNKEENWSLAVVEILH